MVTAPGEDAAEPLGEETPVPAGEADAGAESVAGDSGEPLLPGAFVYTPAADFSGEDTFTIAVTAADGFSTTLPVTVTVLSVNDAPQIDLEALITVTVGDDVNLPVVVLDVDSSSPMLIVDALPPNLALVDGTIEGFVAEEAAGPYFSTLTATDAEGESAFLTVEWVVLAVESPGEETLPDESGPPAEGETDGSVPDAETGPETETPLPQEEQAPESPLPPPDDSSAQLVPGIGEAGSIEVSAQQMVAARSGSGPWSGYAWSAPLDFGACPVSGEAIAAQPITGEAGQAAGAETGAEVGVGAPSDPTSAPALEFEVPVPAPGDYAVAVCGCAPQLMGSVFAGVNDTPLAVAGIGQPLAISGFGAWPGYTWQNSWVDPASGSSGIVSFVAPEAGTQRITLWMGESGLIVYALRLMPLAQAEGEPPAQACGPSLGQ
jgi:hypothetical protein